MNQLGLTHHLSRITPFLELKSELVELVALSPGQFRGERHGLPDRQLAEQNLERPSTVDSVRQYLNRLSGPLLDRIDLTVEMTRLSASDLPLCVKRQNNARKRTGELSDEISNSWQIQKQRCLRQGLPVTANGRMHGPDLLKMLEISTAVAENAASAAVGLNLSVRGYQRILRLARTIADLEAAAEVTFGHVAEAMQFRIRMP